MFDRFMFPAHSGPAVRAEPVTPHDTNRLPDHPARSLYIGGAGNVVVHMAHEEAPRTFVAVPAGTILPVSVQRVLTASTATNIVALY